MSAETLRRAAALMRERAEDATPGPWDWAGDPLIWPSKEGPAANDPLLSMSEAHEETAPHIASWHPAIALAVADVLDDAAENFDLAPQLSFDMRVHIAKQKALALARLYLGDLESFRPERADA